MFSKMMTNRSEQRVIVMRFLDTLERFGFDRKMMINSFPSWEVVDPFIYKFSTTLDTAENFH